MKLSLNLLKKFTKTDKSAQEIADRITLSLTEVEHIEEKGSNTIIEIENKALTHRPDCFSHLGIAREIAAYFNVPCEDPLTALSAQKIDGPTDEMPLSVTVESADLVHRYMAVALTGITIAPSPQWLIDSLEHVGIRPINNVVDVTNYVMIELGQPLHAFDYDTLTNNTIIVRTAKENESIKTLDGKDRALSTDMLVIADSKNAIGLAGIMGGVTTQITDKTTTIVLEAATFEAKNNRKTSKNLNLRTDAATRFEKTLDPNLPYPALIRAINLLTEIASARVASKIIDIQNQKREASTISVSSDWINTFLGTHFSPDEMATFLQRFNFKIATDKTSLTITVPTYRSDLTMEADIAEEIARVYGYDTIPTTLPSQTDFTPKRNMDLYWRNEVRVLLKGMGFFETMSNPFVGMNLLTKATLEQEEHLQLQNPLTHDQEYMRRNLLPQLLETVKKNLPLTKQMRLYEINKLFVPIDSQQPREPFYLTGITLGDNYRTVKGFVEALFDELGITNYSFAQYPRQESERCSFFDNLYHPNKTAQIYNTDNPTEIWGTVGFIHPTVQKNFTIEGELISFDIPLEMLVKHAVVTQTYRPISAYPPIIEDITVDINGEGDRKVGIIMEKIKQAHPTIIKVELSDSFESRYTFRITFQDTNKNLTEKEVSEIKETIKNTIA